MNMSRPSFPFHGIFASLRDEHGDAFGQLPTDEAADVLPPPPGYADATPGRQMAAHRAMPAEPRQQAASFGGPAAQGPKATGQVAVDIYEQDGYYIIKAPIAGVRLSDLDIEIADNVLTIRGQRAQNDPIAPESYYLQECFWGEFVRSITLPFSIDPKKVKATFNKDSILKILIPKEEKVKIIRITES